ncbi:MAG: hypothetical protein LBR11_01930 [Deltaproteobacteria bacterium]|jgi:hypothetical protein|nr:hypothetical protein [Deltaproteobacteria bacterium]
MTKLNKTCSFFIFPLALSLAVMIWVGHAAAAVQSSRTQEAWNGVGDSSFLNNAYFPQGRLAGLVDEGPVGSIQTIADRQRVDRRGPVRPGQKPSKCNPNKIRRKRVCEKVREKQKNGRWKVVEKCHYETERVRVLCPR